VTILRRAHRLDVAFAATVIGGAVVLLLLGLGMTFFWDEWAFIEQRSLGDISTWFAPHNEHWVTLPVIVYRTLVETVGLQSYVPYHALLLVLHLAVACAVYLLVRRTSRRALALVAGVIVVFFGSGFDDLFWAFQIAFVGTTLLCMAAFLVIDMGPSSGRAVLLSGVMLGALASSGLGLPTAAVITIELLLRREWRRHLWIPAVGAAAYVIWFAAIGHTGVTVNGNPFSLSSLLNVPRTVIQGIGSSAGALTGVGPVLGILPGILTYAIAARNALRGALPVRSTACLLGVLAVFALVGLARTTDTHGTGDAPRITYYSGVLLLVGVAAMVGEPRLAEGRARPFAIASVAIWLALCATWNLTLLVAGRNYLLSAADNTRALVTLELAPESQGRYDPSRRLVIVPSGNALKAIVDRYGSPLGDALSPVPPISEAALAKARLYLFEGGPVPAP
jgi:hypothetical protein